jgi:hypothetical protein
MKTRTLTQSLVACVLIYVLGCKAFPCREYVSQTHKFGRFPLTFRVPAGGIRVGDTLTVTMTVPLAVYDSLTRSNVPVQGGIEVSLPLTRHTKQRFDTSFIYVADRYVTIRTRKGTQKDPYTFAMSREATGWQLSLQYVFKTPMTYYVQPSFRLFDTGEARERDGVCTLGDSNYNAAVRVEANTNQINRLNQTLGIAPANEQEVFGFEVR